MQYSPRKLGNSLYKNKNVYDLIKYVDDRPGHDKRYAIDSSKIDNELEWRPRESFDTGIEKTVRWYLSNESWWSKLL